MADFRRVVTALAVLALLTGFAVTANAQNTGAFACTASAAVPPLLRAEGLTELVGDIVLNCTGGTPVAAAGTIPTANVQIFLGNTTVTSRILSTSDNSSEALLLIDEPGTPQNATPITLAATPQAGCTGVSGGCVVGNPLLPNGYRGIVSGNSVQFIGIPVNPPGTAGTRIFRVTNVRANASTVGAGPAGTPGQVQAFVSISGSTSIPLNNPTQVVGFVQNGLAFSTRKTNGDALSSGGLSFAQCADIKRDTFQGMLRFTENFATAFKLQGTTTQNVPGAVYNTESGLVTGFTTQSAVGTTSTLGLADFGTRLRATFNNIPTGVSVYVSTVNLNRPVTTDPQIRNAVLVAAETIPNGTPNSPIMVTPITNNTVSGATPSTSIGIAQVALSAGSGVAVWEVTGASPLTSDNYDFGVFFAASGNAAGNSPASGVQGTVSGSFAPAPPAFSASSGASASASLPIPRFTDTGSPKNLISINICRTSILFPFVTNQGGFDTGLAIANTSKDPFGTTGQAGTCALNFYGDNAPSAVTSPSVAAGTVYTTVSSTASPNFQGYVIAVCNFQYAHGFAFISDVGARNLAMGYLGLVIDTRDQSGEAFDN